MAGQNRAYDLLVIGAGPGGYVAAIRAAQLGLTVGCIEKGERLGGVCLNVGCIPSKALLESSERYHQCNTGMADHGIRLQSVSLDLAAMMARKDKVVAGLTGGIDYLFKKNKIERLTGSAHLAGGGVVEVGGAEPLRLEAKAIIIATGSEAASVPGVVIDGRQVVTSTEALAFSSVPRHLVVIGAGAIGLELGSVWHRLGAEVTVVEYLDRVLPTADRDISKQCQRILKKQGITFRLGARIEGVQCRQDGCRITLSGLAEIEADKVLVAAGRKPCTADLGFTELGGKTDDRGFIMVDESWQTSVAGIYAIGDVIGGPMLAHKASEEGIACVEKMVTGYGHVNYQAVPSIVYTSPEVAAVGKTEEMLEQEGVPVNKGTFSFKANGRALALGEADGLVKILAHRDTDRILGVHIIGPKAGDILAEAVVAMEFGASGEDLARSFHAHPTLSEALREAALDLDARAIHG